MLTTASSRCGSMESRRRATVWRSTPANKLAAAEVQGQNSRFGLVLVDQTEILGEPLFLPSPPTDVGPGHGHKENHEDHPTGQQHLFQPGHRIAVEDEK